MDGQGGDEEEHPEEDADGEYDDDKPSQAAGQAEVIPEASEVLAESSNPPETREVAAPPSPAPMPDRAEAEASEPKDPGLDSSGLPAAPVAEELRSIIHLAELKLEAKNLCPV